MNDEPAFPIQGSLGDHQFAGLTLRDYFAAKALPAIIERCAGDTMHGMTRQDYFAGRAYEVADAMLKAREPK